MHLVFYHVAELQEVGHTDGSRLVELLAGLTIIYIGRAEAGQTCLVGPLGEVVELGTVEDRSGKLDTELLTGSTEDGFEDLTEVHTRGHTHRVEHQVYRTSVLEERHILGTYDLGNDTLVTVTTSELVAHLNLTLLGDIDLGHLQDA